MPGKSADRSPLLEAAAHLEEELRKYETLTSEIGRTAIRSEKTLARAVKTVNEAAACRDRLIEHVTALSAAMNDVRLREEGALVKMAEAARHVSERAAAFQALLGRFAKLGEVAQGLNASAGKVAERRAEGATPGEVYEAIGALLEGMTVAVDEADRVMTAAQEADFDQIARDAEALKQQMASSRHRLAQAQRALAERAPS